MLCQTSPALRMRAKFATVAWTLSAVLLAFALVTSAAAQDGLEAGSDFQRAMDDPPSTLAPEFEADAAVAQDEAIEQGEATPGLGTAGRQRVEEIVVQARKRAELVEDTPVAVTVLGETTLRESGITQLDQIQNLVPNMAIQTGLAGQSPVIRIRGVGTSTFEPAFDPGVGLYVDGVFIPRAIGALLDTVDVEQTEVLRGPQGTLFGKNTVGGAINVRTAKPTDEFEGFVLLRPGSYGSLVTRGMLNLPIVDEVLAGRFAISSQSGGGYVDNVFLDTDVSRLGSMAFLGSLRFLPTDHLTIDWSGQYSNDQNNGRGGECVFVQPGALSPLVPAFQPACEELSDPYETNANVSQLNRIVSVGTWGTIEYDVGALGPVDDVVLKSITAWRQQTARQRTDLDQTSFPAVQDSATGGGSPTDGEPDHQQQIQQEIQLNASAWDGRINFVTGFFSFWETTDVVRTIAVDAGAIQPTTANDISTDNFTWAIYGQGTADVTDWLSLTAGLRYTSDRKSFDQIAFDPTTSAPPGGGSGEETFTSWTPAATIALLTPDDWLLDTPVEHLMGYFTYSRGFKGGGFNAIRQPQIASADVVPFQPETLDSFELGAKSIAFDGALTANIALFYGAYDDIQVTQFLTEVDPNDPSSIVSQRVTRNAAEATTKGVEFELQARPIDGLVVTGSLGYVDARYDDFADAENQLSGATFNRAGETFPRTPAFNSFLSLQYSLPLEVSSDSPFNGWLTPRLEWAYRSSYHILPPELVDATQRGFNLLNVRLSYDFLSDRAQVALWAKNLLDEAYFSEAIGVVQPFGYVSRFYEAPLTFGGELSYRF